CYDPPSFDRLFRDQRWTSFWRTLKLSLDPRVVDRAYQEFAYVKSQGREATRLYALATYHQWEASIRAATEARAQGRDPREVLVRALQQTQGQAGQGGANGAV
ncbi:MAG TPA: hypothetical protein VMG99_09150, partial [Thermoplasmata archaeon]|nr:hypothetical protein [Thermoplasmata archaeon]